MSNYRQKEAMKRTLIALAGTLLFHLLLVGFLFWLEYRRVELNLYSGPVRITLGVPDGVDEPPVSEPRQDESQKETDSEPPPETAEPPAETVESTDSSADARPVETTEDTLDTPQETPEVTEETNRDSSQREEQLQEAAVAPVMGETFGNTHELHLESAGGKAGRNLWIPIYLYMPVPSTLMKEMVDQAPGDPGLGITPEEDRAVINRYYKRAGVEYHLKEEAPWIIPLDERPEIWIVLERMGYDLSQAEYKMSRYLRDVEIHFTVSPVQGGSNSGRVELIECVVEKSSGYQDIDEAVLYGFQQSSYYNDSERDLKGRFVYRFR